MALRFSPGGFITVWDLATQTQIDSIQLTDFPVQIVFNPDGNLIAYSAGKSLFGSDYSVHVWNVKTDKEELHFNTSGDSNWANSLSFNADGSVLATGRPDGLVQIWDTESGEPLVELMGHTDWITNVAFNPSGTLLASSSRDGTIRLWGVTAVPRK